jgi:hypothetical protein
MIQKTGTKEEQKRRGEKCDKNQSKKEKRQQNAKSKKRKGAEKNLTKRQ